MSQSAYVRSIEVLQDVKVGLIAFCEDARSVLSAVDMEVRRTRDWLEREQLTYWKAQIKRRNEEVGMARSELHRRRLSASNSEAISDTEQKEALRLAQRRLAEAEEKHEKVKRWIPILEHAITEYHAHSQPLGDHLAGNFENTSGGAGTDAQASLHSYLTLQAPSTPRFVPGSGDSSAQESTTTSSASAATAQTGEAVKSTEATTSAEAGTAPSGTR